MSTQTMGYLVEDYDLFRNGNPELVAAWYRRWQRPHHATTLPSSASPFATLLSLSPSPQLPLPSLLPSSDTPLSSPLPAWDNATLPVFNYDPKFATEHFEVRESAGAGLGAFATKDIKEGEVIMTETPLFLAKEIQIWNKWQSLSEEDTAAYLSLHAYPRGGGEVTSDNRVTSIFSTNRFKTTGDENGIFIKCSRFNHQCRPYSNCGYRYHKEENLLVVTARKEIPKGQEITISYSDKPDELPGFYGFECNCPGCEEKRGMASKKHLTECQVL